MKQVNWLGIIFSLVLTAVAVAAVNLKNIDRTKTVKATGSSVVQAVVDKIGQTCIFPNDRQFIRRMAYVESQDGKDVSTFRPSFFGGIWQITKINYEATKSCKGKLLRDICNKIKQEFGIEWRNTTWEDLLKPFYSGLAAYLSLAQKHKTVTGNPVGQEQIWINVFHQKAFNHLRNFSEVASELSMDCNGNADIVFLLDDSGSVGRPNFAKVKNFLIKTTRRLKINPDNIRVSLVKFSTTTSIISYLNSDKTHAAVEARIKYLKYNGGGTATHLGIDVVTNKVFSTLHGAKETKDAPRILVLLTDGQSNRRALTIAAAERAKKEKINIFSVGVSSGIDYDELRQVASECNLVFTLNSFDDFDNFIYELTKKACMAKAHISLPEPNGNNTVNNGTTEIRKKLTGENETFGIVVDSSDKGNNTGNNTGNDTGKTIVVESNCAVVKIYGSFDNENPSESMFEITGTASDGRPVVLFVKADKDGKPLFLSFEATRVNTSEKICFNDSNFVVKINRGKPKVGQVLCKENGVLRNCTSVDLIESKWGDKICPHVNDIDIIGNPCTEDRLRAREMYFPHPNDNTKFLRCDMKGRVYVIVCPKGLFYEQGRDSCGTGSSLPDTKRPLHTNNPCTYDNIKHNRMYFHYPKNHHYFIQCDEWSDAWVVPCPDKDVWDQKVLQCIPEHVEVKSPCTKEAITNGQFYFPYPGNKHKFIHCTGEDSWVVQSCGHMVYNDKIHNCLPGN